MTVLLILIYWVDMTIIILTSVYQEEKNIKIEQKNKCYKKSLNINNFPFFKLCHHLYSLCI